ncbi:hypothetical protein GALL_510630 [mine drainage metagenome]|uniref:Uncharacterized protein n=1 Tax=mine drainage metagenome TaxID=410659 RepID=A0A1J5P7Y9_9ZZZZ
MGETSGQVVDVPAHEGSASGLTPFSHEPAVQSILGYMFVLTLSLVGLVGLSTTRALQGATNSGAATAQQAQQILVAAKSYIAAAPAGLPSTSASAPAFVTLPQMVPAPGNLFPGYAAPGCNTTYGCANPYQQNWQVEVVCAHASCPYSGLVSGSGPWQAFLMSFGGQDMPLALTPQIANQVGANGGNTPSDDAAAGIATTQSIEGAYAGWSYPLTGLYNPGPGHLFCRV